MSNTSNSNINGSQSVEAVILEADNECHIQVSLSNHMHSASSRCVYRPFNSDVAAMAKAKHIPPVTSSDNITGGPSCRTGVT
eukprot:9132285-Ditylum_brightwellii.AAC.1